MTEDIKLHSEALFLELSNGIELIKDHPVAFVGAAGVALPVKGTAERATAASRPRREIPAKDYTWVVGPYSRLRDGTDPVDSPAFLIAPGYRVQLQACINGNATLELTASVKVHRTDASDAPRHSQMP
ncbi:hypothetical protein HPB48_020019 [Haemaphysalis longicornis]|uniref:Uncharacterized protein n=1 Tax=Haemaphysalis longicornis TaxID=44386 RepID=A0A9J6GQ41_HAELO|nr:hypothetical protein HPB48_020019 [Haemaphysalis longicornis]